MGSCFAWQWATFYSRRKWLAAVYDIVSCLTRNDVPHRVNSKVSSTIRSGWAQLVISPRDWSQVAASLPVLHDAGVPVVTLGIASNALIGGSDTEPIAKAILETRRLKGMRISVNATDRTGRITAEAGTKIADVSKAATEAGLTGLEFACRIPGSTGGAVATEAGHPIYAYAEKYPVENGTDWEPGALPRSVGDVIAGADAVDRAGNLVELSAADLRLGDKGSIFTAADNDLVLIRAHFAVRVASDPRLVAQTAELIREGRESMRDRNRRRNPESVRRTLGCTFISEHPSYRGRSAAELIRGTDAVPETLTVGGMYHATSTANIISNIGLGSVADYRAISDRIQQAVHDQHGVRLIGEVQIIE